MSFTRIGGNVVGFNNSRSTPSDSDFNELKNDNAKLKKEIRCLRDAISDVVAPSLERMEETLNEKDKKIEDLEARLAEQEREIQELKERGDAQQDQIEALESSLEAMKERLQASARPDFDQETHTYVRGYLRRKPRKPITGQRARKYGEPY